MTELREDVTTAEFRQPAVAPGPRDGAAGPGCGLCALAVADGAVVVPDAGGELVVPTSAHRSFAELDDGELALLVDVWAARYAELAARAGVRYVLVLAD